LVCFDPESYIAAAVLLLIIPLDWLIAAVLAAIFHEICHLAAILFCDGAIESIVVGLGGTEIIACLNGKRKEFIAILSGPLGSFLLVGLCHTFPKLAICAFIQGLFNLLPILPLDGGRMAQCILLCFWPEKIRQLQKITEGIAVTGTLILLIAACLILKLSLLSVVSCVFLFLKVVFRKTPCKEHQIRVQ